MISDEELSQRYFSDRDIFNEELDFDQEQLYEQHPHYYNFYPTPEIFKKLMIRMTQIKEQQEDFQLWLGFQQIYQRDGISVWGPAASILPPQKSSGSEEQNKEEEEQANGDGREDGAHGE